MSKTAKTAALALPKKIGPAVTALKKALSSRRNLAMGAAGAGAAGTAALAYNAAKPAPVPVPTGVDAFIDKAKTVGNEVATGVKDLASKAGAGIQSGVAAAKDWAGKPGLSAGSTGLNRGQEAGIAAGAIGSAAILAKLLRKRRQPAQA